VIGKSLSRRPRRHRVRRERFTERVLYTLVYRIRGNHYWSAIRVLPKSQTYVCVCVCACETLGRSDISHTSYYIVVKILMTYITTIQLSRESQVLCHCASRIIKRAQRFIKISTRLLNGTGTVYNENHELRISRTTLFNNRKKTLLKKPKQKNNEIFYRFYIYIIYRNTLP